MPEGTRAVCKVEGCDRTRNARGLCRMHWKRVRRAELSPKRNRPPKPPRPKGASVSERFWRRVERRGPDECWMWTGRVDSHGYGRLKVERSEWLAHRWSYEAIRGPIPDGLHIDHLCRTCNCVNPWHMEPVTSRENTLRGAGPAAINARKTHCIRGHEFTSENTIIRSGGGRACRECVRLRQQRLCCVCLTPRERIL